MRDNAIVSDLDVFAVLPASIVFKSLETKTAGKA